MEKIQFEILPVTLLEDYLLQIDRSVYSNFKNLKDSELSSLTSPGVSVQRWQ